MTDYYPEMNSENTALLVIDIINSCCHIQCEIPEWKIHFSKIRGMVPKLVDFIDEYRNKVNQHVILTKTVPWQKEYLPQNINILYTDPKVVYYTKDKSSFPQDFYQLEAKPSDLVVAKKHYDAFTSSKIHNYLSANKIRYVVVTGVFGDGCVLASICGGFAKGFNLVILEDLIETTDDPIRQDIQSGLKKYTWPVMYGRTINSKDLKRHFN